MISGINKELNSVMVEWYENGEAKGKEVVMNYFIIASPFCMSTRVLLSADVISAWENEYNSKKPISC